MHLVVSPTKMMERMEWLVEKATEIGFDRISFINCDNSERRVIKVKRLEKIAVSAMKQSRKAWKPIIDEIVSFDELVADRGTEVYCPLLRRDKKSRSVQSVVYIGQG